MRLIILSRSKSLHSTRRLMEEARRLKVECLVVNPLRCQLVVGPDGPEVHVFGKKLEGVNVVLPRIGTSITDYGLLVVRHFEAMEALDPGNAYALASRAQVENQLGRTDQALALLQQASQRQPRAGDLWMVMGQTAEDLGDRDIARQAYATALALQPDWAFPISGLLGLDRGGLERATVFLFGDDQVAVAEVAMHQLRPGRVGRPLRDGDHPQAEQRAGEGQRGAPLAGAGLGGELLRPLLLVVVRLRHGGVGLVRAGGRDALVLVIDTCRGAECLLETMRTEEGRRPPLAWTP